MGALSDRRFQRLLIGNSLSSFGDSALYLSLGIWAKDLTGSNAAAGGVFLAQGLPSLIAPVTGHLIDRVRRRPLLIVANTATAAAVLALLLVHSRNQLWLIYSVAAFYGGSFTLLGPAAAGLLKDLLPEASLAAANASLATVSQGLRIVSPLVGAGLYARFGGGSLAVLDSATFLVAIVMLASIQLIESPIGPAERLPLRQRLFVGVTYIRETPALAQILTAATMTMLVIGFYESLTFAAIAAIGRPPSFFGVLMSIQGAGSILGGVAAGRLIRVIGEARTLGGALALWAVASLLYADPTLEAMSTALVLFGIAVPLFAVALGTATQRLTPPRLQGRVGSAAGMLTNLTQTVSIALGAALIGHVNYRLLLAAVAVVATAAALPVLTRPVPAAAPQSPAAAEARTPG